jgi:hypothetical protein
MALMIKIGVDSASVQTGLARVESLVSRFGAKLAGGLAAGLGFAAFASAAKGALDLADRLDDLSKRYDINARGLQLIGNVAKENGSDLEAVSQALKFLGKNAQMAAQDGGGELVRAFAAIGLNVSELRSLRPDEIFLRLSDAFRSGRLGGQEFAVTSQLLGRSFEQLLPVLRMGREEIERVGNSKGVFSEQTIVQLSKVEEFLEKINNLKKIVAGEITFGFMRSFKEFLGEGPAGSPARALRDAIFGQDKAPAGARSGGSKISGLGTGDSLEDIKTQERLDKEFVRYRVKLIDAAVAGSSAAESILRNFEDRAANNSEMDATFPRIKQISSMQVLADSLQQVGGGGRFAQIGGAETTQRDQLAVLKNIEKNTAKTSATFDGKSFDIGVQ